MTVLVGAAEQALGTVARGGQRRQGRDRSERAPVGRASAERGKVSEKGNFMQTRAHWEEVYRAKPVSEVSWFQEHSELSLRIIAGTGVAGTGRIIDVGGGASTLVDDLLARSFEDVTVLDISAAALSAAQERLGSRAAQVIWMEADIIGVSLPRHHYDVWHDRAVFHFLTRAEDRKRYVQAVCHAVRRGGHVIVATFAPDGPLRCSGLDTIRYSADALHDEFGEAFELVESTHETHSTPSGTEQQFTYCYCRIAAPVRSAASRPSGP